ASPCPALRERASIRFRQPQHSLGDVRQDQLPADRRDARDLDLAEKPLDMKFARIAHAAMRQDRCLAGAVPAATLKRNSYGHSWVWDVSATFPSPGLDADLDFRAPAVRLAGAP